MPVDALIHRHSFTACNAPVPCRSNGRLRGMLEQEAGVASWGAGLTSTTDDASQGDALTGAPLWELSLAATHFHPHVARAAASIIALPPDSEPI